MSRTQYTALYGPVHVLTYSLTRSLIYLLTCRRRRGVWSFCVSVAKCCRCLSQQNYTSYISVRVASRALAGRRPLPVSIRRSPGWAVKDRLVAEACTRRSPLCLCWCTRRSPGWAVAEACNGRSLCCPCSSRSSLGWSVVDFQRNAAGACGVEEDAYYLVYAVSIGLCLQCFDAVGWASGRAASGL